MRFATPLALLLLLTLPYFFWLGRPRQSARRRWRDWVSLAVRLLIMLLLIFSLAGSQMVRAADELAVIFLVDASDSISHEQQQQAEAYVQQAMVEMTAEDQAAVVVFGANALVERPMSGLAELAPISSAPQALHTDLAEAIRLGLALFPAGSGRRLVILSDGAATTGDALEAAELAASAGVQIDYVPLTERPLEAEAWLVAVDAPTRVLQGETFRLDVSVDSTQEMPATVRVLAGGQLVYEETQRLVSGRNNFSLGPFRALEQEFVRYTVQLVPADDVYYQNNQLAVYTEVVGPPRILLVASDGTLDDSGVPLPDESPALRLALEEAGLPVDRVTPAELPATLPQLSNYATIVLVNVNAKNLSPRKMELLQRYVRDLGGGLVVVGGPQSYGMGGYYRTPLEEALPLDMQIKDQERFPSVSIVIVIDRSGSMAMQEGGMTKIQLADEAAVRVVELLNDFDEITVIPVDTMPDDVIGPVQADDKDPIIQQIRQIGAGGGGINVRTGVQAAAEALLDSEHQVKHVIVLADGADSNEQEGVPQLLEALVAEGVTISMVSIGEGKDVPWLRQMAELGEGRFHLTTQAANLPQIFTQETTSIQRSYLVEERFFPNLVGRSPILSNINRVPPLYGYVGTSAKATAQVVLETHLGDPLLATWQYGLGRVVAWTSDASGRWANEWVRWAQFPQFWAQTVRWSITQGRDSNVETVITYDDEVAHLTVDARNTEGVFLNNLLMEANVIGPEGEALPLLLAQVAPGRYEGAFVPPEEGAYLLRVTGTQGDEGDVTVGQTTGWVLGYSPEYQALEPDLTLLRAVADLTGGRDVGDEPAAVFEHTVVAEPTTRPIWPWLTLLAVVLLPLDVALRRLVIARRDVERAWAALTRRWRPPTAAPQRSEQVDRLFQAKRRAGTTTVDLEESPADMQPPPEHELPPDVPPTIPPPASPSSPLPAESGDSLASRLRERRQQRRVSDDS